MSSAKASQVKQYYLCESCLTVGAVPLFLQSRNKELLEKIGGTSDSFILSELIKSVGVNIDDAAASLPSVCKKCARKIFSCCIQYHEVEQLFHGKLSNTLSSEEEATEGGKKRFHGNSPSGLTPCAKKTKDLSKEKFLSKSKSRKTLFELSSTWSKQESVEDEIANLMSLPVKENKSSSSVVKIFIAYPSGKVIEHECEDHEKLLVTNLALKNYNAAAVGVTKLAPLNSKVAVEIGKQVKREISTYSKDPSNSFKYAGNLWQLAEFHNETLIKDVQEKLPVLHTLVESSFRSSKKVKNASNKEALIFASFLNPWMPINNFTFRINTILVVGGCKKEEIDCFNKLGISSHPNTLRNMQKKAAVSFDKVVLDWKNNTVKRENKIRLFEEVIESQLHSALDDDSQMEICTVDFSVAAVSGFPHYTEEVYKSCKEMLPSSENGIDLFEDSDILFALNTLKGETTENFRIVGDNWDLEVKARCQTKTQNNKSLHYFHSYAVKDRISPKGLNKVRPQKSIDELEMQEILPTVEVQEAIISDLAYIIPRVIVRYLPPYNAFCKAIVYHIPHPNSKEMSERSEVCPLGLHFLNPNKAAEMAQILEDLHTNYVPLNQSSGSDDGDILQRIIFDGDQLTEERARNCQWANTLAESEMDRLDGITTAFADWHLKKMLLGICMKLFFKDSSAAEIGTSCASMNRTGKSNAKKGPEKDYNAFRHFMDRETEAHIITRWMKFVGMEDMKESPSIRVIPDVSNWDLERKAEWLYKEAQVFLQEVFLQTNIPDDVIMLDEAHKEGFSCRDPDCDLQFPLHSARVRHEQSKHGLMLDNGGDDNRDMYGYYKCRCSCNLVFTTSATRKRHECTQHPEVEFGQQLENSTTEEPNDDDFIFNYHNNRIQLGLLLMDIVDSIKEGDGYRLINCYKFVLLFAYKFGNTKYAYALLLFFVQISAVLSEDESFCLIVNRFINSMGKLGGNIPLDLFMEHLNLLLKRLAKGMGANITNASLQRAARSVVPLHKVMDSIYKDCLKVKRSGHHGSKNPEETVSIIVNDLLLGKVFEKQPGRNGYPSFPNFKCSVLDIDHRDFFKWAKDRFHDWKAIYEVPQH